MTRSTLDPILKRWTVILALLGSLYGIAAWALTQTQFIQNAVSQVKTDSAKVVQLNVWKEDTVTVQLRNLTYMTCRMYGRDPKAPVLPACTELFKGWVAP